MTITEHCIDLLRHDQSEGGDRFRRTTDDPLNEAGWQQMLVSVQGITPWNVVITSPLRRCAGFASQLCEKYGMVPEFEPPLGRAGFWC